MPGCFDTSAIIDQLMCDGVEISHVCCGESCVFGRHFYNPGDITDFPALALTTAIDDKTCQIPQGCQLPVKINNINLSIPIIKNR